MNDSSISLARGGSASIRPTILASVLNRKCGSIWPCSSFRRASTAWFSAWIWHVLIAKNRWKMNEVSAATSTLATIALAGMSPSQRRWSTPSAHISPSGQPIAAPTSRTSEKKSDFLRGENARTRSLPISRCEASIARWVEVPTHRPIIRLSWYQCHQRRIVPHGPESPL